MAKMNEARELEESAGAGPVMGEDGPDTGLDPGTAVTMAPGAATDPVTLKEQVLEALRNVNDPELGINIVDLGLVYGVDVDDGAVHITYTLTTMGCPIGPLIEAEMQRFLSGVAGVRNVDAEMVLRPPWTPEMMSEEAKAALGFF
jgi:metal-sulfur cluster biosynthetic enzyme